MTSLFDRYLQESDAFAAKNKTPELTRATRCLKLTLIGANVLFLIFACVLMGVGSVAYTHSVGPLAGTEIPMGIVTLGVFIMFLSFIGCFGAWRESRLFLGCYFFFLMLLTILLFAVGLGVYSKREEAGYYMIIGWTESPNDVRVSFQNQLMCCGLITFNDTLAGHPCPEKLKMNDTTHEPVACLAELTDLFRASMQNVGGTGVAFAVLMFLGMIFVCVLMRGIRQKSLKEQDNIGAVEDSTNPQSLDASV
jgi:hypothetical protein